MSVTEFVTCVQIVLFMYLTVFMNIVITISVSSPTITCIYILVCNQSVAMEK